MPSTPSYRQKENRWLSWARIAKGPKGRKPCYAKSADEAYSKALALETECATLAPPAYDRDSFAWFVYNVFEPHVYQGLKKTSQRKYDSLFVHHVLRILGHLPIASIGYQELAAFPSSMERADKRKGPISIHQKAVATDLAKEVLDLYAKLETAKGNRARVDWQLAKTPVRPKKKKRIEPAPDYTEQFMKACQGTYMVGPSFAALFLGLRRGEVCGLKWSDIDREKMQITVREQHQPEYGDVLIPTKGEERVIPIPQTLLDRLDALGNHKSRYVFTNAKGKRLSPGAVSHYPSRICERHELQKHTFHDLRSLAASNLAALTKDPLMVMEILGHTQIDTSLIYMNAKNDVKRKALERLLDSVAKPVDIALTTSESSSQAV
jgi:integrase